MWLGQYIGPLRWDQDLTLMQELTCGIHSLWRVTLLILGTGGEVGPWVPQGGDGTNLVVFPGELYPF